MKIFKLPAIIILTIIISSCASYITLDQIQTIKRDMTYLEVRELVEKAPEESFRFTSNEMSYYVEVYQMQTGMSTTSTYTPPSPGFPGGLTSSETLTSTADYLFLYKEQNLFYWGFFYELNKSEDEEVLKISQDLIEAYQLKKESVGSFYY
ncbi:MAG: hypothetical protein K9N06_13310 [Candidatus Cloacimonetes bacterium]|nr:hypothetical protein [Candidatus Cloacimonadota bacterium]